MPRQRLKLEYIEAKPKRYLTAKSYRWSVPKSQRVAEGLATIKEYIEAGRSLPSSFYRRDRETTTDPLLENDGVLHLHPYPGSRELIYLVQYEDSVFILEVSDHHHFADEPRGAVLHNIHDPAIAQHEQDYDQEVAAKNADIRARLFKKNECRDTASLLRRFMTIIGAQIQTKP